MAVHDSNFNISNVFSKGFNPASLTFIPFAAMMKQNGVNETSLVSAHLSMDGVVGTLVNPGHRRKTLDSRHPGRYHPDWDWAWRVNPGFLPDSTRILVAAIDLCSIAAISRAPTACCNIWWGRVDDHIMGNS
jgi:hypothetical protein